MVQVSRRTTESSLGAGERMQIMHSVPKTTVARGLPAGLNQGRSMPQDAQGGGLEGLLVV